MKILQFIGRALTIISVGFVIWALATMDYSFWRTLPKARVLAVIAGCSLLYAIFFSLLSLGWFLLLKAVSAEAKKLPFTTVNWIYSKSNLMKYLPGNVLEFVGRNIFTSKFGISHTQIAFASFIETILIIAASLGLGLIGGVEIFENLVAKYDLTRLFSDIWLPLLFVIVMSFIYAALVIARKTKESGIAAERIRALFSASWKVLLLQAVVFINFTLTFFFIFTFAFGMDLGTEDFIFILSGFTLSWTAGFLTPGAPGGLGVKEIGLVSLLSPRYGMEPTLVAGVLHRFISIFGDVLMYLFSIVILRLKRE